MNDYINCPACGGESKAVKFTWWGGVLGSKVLKHAKCTSCGKTYNGKTGASNTNSIIIYSIVVGVIAFGLVFVALIGVALLGRF